MQKSLLLSRTLYLIIPLYVELDFELTAIMLL